MIRGAPVRVRPGTKAPYPASGQLASTRTIGVAIGPAATGADVVRLLEETAVERLGAPLVLLSDNGPAYACAKVAAWWASRRVLHIFSLPRTPQHNAASEHGMRELKEEARPGARSPLDGPGGRRAALGHRPYDGYRLRASRGWRTAVEDDLQRPHRASVVSRGQVLKLASYQIAEALLQYDHARARRRAVREAILGTLEHFALIQRTRGGPGRTHKPRAELPE